MSQESEWGTLGGMFSHASGNSTQPSFRGPVIRPGLTSIRRHAKTALVLVVVLGATIFTVLALRGPAEGIPVLVSSKDIEGGGAVSAGSVRVLFLPSEAVPDNALRSVDELDGLVATRDVVKQTVLTSDQLAEEAAVSAGYSRLSIPLSFEHSHIASGDVVQIWGPLGSCSDATCPARLLASNVQILAVSEEDQGLLAGSGGPYVTLLAPATDVPAILHASEASSVHFVIPSPRSE